MESSRNDDILRDVMSRDGTAQRMRSQMGQAEGITMGFPNQTLGDVYRAHSGRSNASGPSQPSDVDHGPFK